MRVSVRVSCGGVACDSFDVGRFLIYFKPPAACVLLPLPECSGIRELDEVWLGVTDLR